MPAARGYVDHDAERVAVLDLGVLNRDLGITMLLVEQNARMALKAADYGYIMESGKIVLDGTADELVDNEDVKEFYLGGGGEVG